MHGAAGRRGEDWDHEAEAADDDMDMGGDVGSDGEPAPPSPDAALAPEGLRPGDSPSPSPAGKFLVSFLECFRLVILHGCRSTLAFQEHVLKIISDTCT